MADIQIDDPRTVAGKKLLDSLGESDRDLVLSCASFDQFIQDFNQLDGVKRAQAGVRSKVQANIARFSDNIKPFLAVVDTLVSSNPEVAALVWGAAKLVLLVASNYANFFNKLSDMLSNISLALSQYREILTLVQEQNMALTDTLDCLVTTAYNGCLQFFQSICRIFLKKDGSK